jgi:hypothetical protein
MQLRLDSQALAALFPEGTQARVDLQSAVIAEFCRKHIKTAALGPEVQTQIEVAMKDANTHFLSAAGILHGRFSNVVLSDEVKRKISEAASEAVQDGIRKAITSEVESMRVNVEARVQRAVDNMVASTVDKQVYKRVKEVADGILGGVS